MGNYVIVLKQEGKDVIVSPKDKLEVIKEKIAQYEQGEEN